MLQLVARHGSQTRTLYLESLSASSVLQVLPKCPHVESVFLSSIGEEVRRGRRGLEISRDCNLDPRLLELLGSLQSMTSLSIEMCARFVRIPEAMMQLRMLTKIYVSSDHLKELPASLGNLSALTKISVYSKRLPRLPESIGQLRNLQKLYVMSDALTELPESVGNLEGLESLRLRNCRQLSALPAGVGLLPRLALLNVHGCVALRALPAPLPALVELDCEDCPHLFLPDAIPEPVTQRCVRTLRLTGGDQWYGKHLNLDMHRQLSAALVLPDFISGFLLRLRALERLELSSCTSLESLPEALGECLVQLQVLKLTQCPALTALPSSLGQMSSLKTLSLAGCDSLCLIPDSLGELPLITSLYLHCRSLVALPSSIGKLASLRQADPSQQAGPLQQAGPSQPTIQKTNVYVSEEPFTISFRGCASLSSLPESLGLLAGLKKLDLSYCAALTSLPESIGELTALQCLHLSGCPALTSLPESLGQLATLQTLDVQYCAALASLPESLGQLTTLRSLDLRNCVALTSLPESVGSLPAVTLCAKDLPRDSTLHGDRRLLIKGCSHLTALPASLGQCTDLQLPALEDFAALTRLPNSAPLLQTFVKPCKKPFQHGFLGYLRTPMWKEQLAVDGDSLPINNMALLQALPDCIGQLASLSVLHLRGCPVLTSLPDSVGQLSTLLRLHLEDCSGLTQLPATLGQLTALRELYLLNCTSLTGLPDSVRRLRVLQRLRLTAYPALTALPDSVGDLQSLRFLQLSCPSLATLPPSFAFLPQAIQLVLEAPKLNAKIASLVRPARRMFYEDIVPRHAVNLVRHYLLLRNTPLKLLLLILASRRRRQRHLPPELWQWLHDEFDGFFSKD